MAKDLLCFNCFHTFKLDEVWFRCQNPARQENQTEACKIETDSKLKEPRKHAFPLQSYFAYVAARFNKAPLHAKCDICNYLSTERLCPHCHWKLPSGHGQTEEHIIAVVGNTSSGKSHYFTVLMERELKNKGSVYAVDTETEKLYNDDYRDPLFRGKHAIPSTDTNVRKHRRLIYRITLEKPKQQTLTFVFYDIAGELLARTGDDEEATTATRFLWNSSGIIYLANPKDIDQWGPFLNGNSSTFDPQATPPEDLFARIMRELRLHQEIKAMKKIPVPMAVCISQFDRLYEQRVDAGLDDDLFNPISSPLRKGHLDKKQVKSESDSLQEFMLRTEVGAVVNLAVKNFTKTVFFAVSALGDSPIGPNLEIPKITPNRVGVPFFWILENIGGLRGIRK